MGCYVFFFQAEDGIRDHCVTGVQTCALPISLCDLKWNDSKNSTPVSITLYPIELRTNGCTFNVLSTAIFFHNLTQLIIDKAGLYKYVRLCRLLLITLLGNVHVFQSYC